jgi:hypothetical protein
MAITAPDSIFAPTSSVIALQCIVLLKLGDLMARSIRCRARMERAWSPVIWSPQLDAMTISWHSWP